MSKSELKYTIKEEINKVNKVIDQKIVRGLPYNREAKYHKNLLKRLDIVRRSSFVTRGIRSLAMMMF